MKKISVLLPTVRPYAVAQSIREFADTNAMIDYELVVVSPFEIKGINTKWVHEYAPLGSVIATDIAYDNSEGEYVVCFSDDVSPTKGCLAIMYDFMKTHQNPFIGAFKMITTSGREIGPFGAYNKFYACYGCLSRQTVEMIGGVFSKEFVYSWADIDMSLRCYELGGKVEKCDEAIMIPRQLDDEIYRTHRSKYWQMDVDMFLNKWHDKLGQGIERRDGAVNHRL